MVRSGQKVGLNTDKGKVWGTTRFLQVVIGKGGRLVNLDQVGHADVPFVDYATLLAQEPGQGWVVYTAPIEHRDAPIR